MIENDRSEILNQINVFLSTMANCPILKVFFYYFMNEKKIGYNVIFNKDCILVYQNISSDTQVTYDINDQFIAINPTPISILTQNTNFN